MSAMSVPRPDEFPAAERAPAELEVLSCGHEDVYGLWDMAAAVNTVVPDRPVAHTLRLAQAVVLDLLERGLLELRQGHRLEEEDAELVPPDQYEAAVTDLASWDPYATGEDDPQYLITSTPAGIEEYYRQGYAAAGEDPPPR
jgi:hypothetical protein